MIIEWIVSTIFMFFAKLSLAFFDAKSEILADSFIGKLFVPKTKVFKDDLVSLECGNNPINLNEMRLSLSSAFGSYFTNQLEKENSYERLVGQVKSSSILYPNYIEVFQKLYLGIIDPNGPRILIFAGEGGFGKTTLAVKLIRCLFSRNVIDVIIGDSAKSENFDPVSGEIVSYADSAYSEEQLIIKLNEQLGIPNTSKMPSLMKSLQLIKDRLAGRRTLLVIDNLETFKRGGELIFALRQLASRDIRVIATTRTVADIPDSNNHFFTVHLIPLKTIKQVMQFAKWHIERYAFSIPHVTNLQSGLRKKKNIKALLNKSGGSPLLIQLLITDVARTSWTLLESIPSLFGEELLDYLYQERWSELDSLGNNGKCALSILRYINDNQYSGGKITYERLSNHLASIKQGDQIRSAIKELEERFLLINSDIEAGNYSIFPSLSEYINKQEKIVH